MKEIWVPIEGYFGRYEVSNYGQIKSLIGKSKILKQFDNGRGYKTLVLFKGASIGKKYRIHHLVLLAFKGKRPKDFEGSHLNGDSLDNRSCNLIWESAKNNQSRRISHGTSTQGSGNGNSKINNSQVNEIRLRKKSGETSKQISKDFNLTVDHITAICNGKKWAHII